MAVLPDGATFEEFAEYVLTRRNVPLRELRELYERRLRLKSVTIARGETMRKMLPPEDRDLTMNLFTKGDAGYKHGTDDES